MFILGTKLKMTQIWKEEKVIPVTVIKAAGNKVGLVRTKDKEGYDGIQLIAPKNKTKTTKREFRAKNSEWSVNDFHPDQEVDVSVFGEGDTIRISGYSKGRGFQGVVKRHGFGGGPQTHGQKNRQRAPGSIGSTAPQRVTPGRRMAGHMGTERVTIKNLRIVQIDPEKKLLYVRGAVPGAIGAVLEIQKLKAKK